MILSLCLNVRRYNSAPEPNACHQTFNQVGKTKIELHLKRLLGLAQ